MSGVITGTRLDRLLELRGRLDQEIAAERLRLALDDRDRPHRGKKQSTGVKTPNVVDMTLGQLGVTTREVKEWALSVGLITRIARGRVGQHLVDAYADAHRQVSA